MKQVGDAREHLLASDWLLSALIALLPAMKPAVDYPIVLSDLLFPFLAFALMFEHATGRRRLRWHGALALMLAYVASHVPSLLATPQLQESLQRLIMELALVGLAAATMVTVSSEARLRLVTFAWLAATATLGLLSVVSLVAFVFDPGGALYQYSQFHFGTLPAGQYPRLELSFLNANMACNYLTASLGLLLVAWHQRWVSNAIAGLALAAILIAAIPTLSAGLGGIALSVGMGGWLLRRSRSALIASIMVAAASAVALALTPIPHVTAPFVMKVPWTSLVLAPSARFLTWSSALSEFLRHPLLGHGIGIPAATARYIAPSGELQVLSDAHNTFLSIAAQTGIVGLCGLSAVIAYATWLAFSGNTAARLLAFTFLNGFVYQGLGGSFENARHLWIMLGLAAAANRLPLTPADENSRKADAPSLC